MEAEKKTFQIDWKGKKEDVTIKRLSFGESNDLQDESSTIKLVGTQRVLEVKQGLMNTLMVLKSLVKAPFVINLKNVRDMPNTIGKKVQDEVTEFNTLSLEKKEV